MCQQVKKTDKITLGPSSHKGQYFVASELRKAMPQQHALTGIPVERVLEAS